MTLGCCVCVCFVFWPMRFTYFSHRIVIQCFWLLKPMRFWKFIISYMLRKRRWSLWSQSPAWILMTHVEMELKLSTKTFVRYWRCWNWVIWLLVVCFWFWNRKSILVDFSSSFLVAGRDGVKTQSRKGKRYLPFT